MSADGFLGHLPMFCMAVYNAKQARELGLKILKHVNPTTHLGPLSKVPKAVQLVNRRPQNLSPTWSRQEQPGEGTEDPRQQATNDDELLQEPVKLIVRGSKGC